MRHSLAIPLALVFSGVVIAATVYLTMPKKATPAVSSAPNPALMRLVSPSDHIFGNPAAPVLIVEYTDFDCAPCKTFHNTLHQVLANQGADGSVAWILREFPLTEIHPNALALARAAECAAYAAGTDEGVGNDLFWKFADALFAKQPVDPSSSLSAVASAAGISGTSFASCYAQPPPEIDARIMADRQNALDMKSTGTPFSIIIAKGKKPVVLDAAYSYDDLRQFVEQAERAR